MPRELEHLPEKRPHIAICGIRGIPACYGGFETFAEELATRLVAAGYDVTVYGRTHVIDHREPYYRGVRIRLLSAPRHKYLETPVHSLRCFVAMLRTPPDVLLVCNAANSPFIWIPRLRGIPVAVNVDGVERKRAKWNMLGRMWYWLGELCSVLFASRLISDAEVIRRYYQDMYHRGSDVIAYGYRENHESSVAKRIARESVTIKPELFQSLGIEPHRYLLFVSRLEPENNAHIALQAFANMPKELKRGHRLVVVGDAPYARDYVESLHKMAGDDVIFTGYRFGEDYEALQLGATLYIQATEVGGTHPALVESMGFANCVVANDTPEHREVLASAGEYYERNDVAALAQLLTQLIADPERVQSNRERARARARAVYSWDKIAHDYEALFLSLATPKAPLPCLIPEPSEQG